MRAFLLTVTVFSMCSCSSSLYKFGQQKKFLYKEVKVDNRNVVGNVREILYVSDSKENCFTDALEGDVITVEAGNLDKALNYFYKNKASWDIKRIQKTGSDHTQMISFSETQIQYEVAYCSFKYLGVINESYDYASFRLIDSK